jgi:prepilin signal peptidase PulO-like enzyme (type II secretory pathway)
MEIYWLVLVGIIGACCASFAAVVAERAGSERSIITGRSECNHCGKTLRWWELTPLLGYVFVRGKCARCHTRIPWQYPTFELFGALAFVVMWIASAELPIYLRVGELIFTTLLLILFYSDWRDEVFDAPILYSAGVIALILAIGRVMWADSASSVIADPLFRWLSEPRSMLGMVVMGGIVGAGFLGLFALPTKGTWMAWGDVILAGVLGIWVGYPGIVVTLILAFYLGAIIGGIMLWLTKGKTKRIAFGPFLIVGALVAQVWSPDILMAIMKLWSIT